MCRLSFTSGLWPLIKRKAFIFCLSLSIVLTIAGCSLFPREYEYTDQELVMDTLVQIKVYAPTEELAKEATRAAFREFKRLELLTNRYQSPTQQKPSQVREINAQAGKKAVPVSEDVFTLIRLSKKYHRETDGAFEVTIGPVVDLWGFGREIKKVPGPKELQAALSLVGSEKILLDEEKQTVFLTQAGMSLDLGAIAKGYATDKAAQILKEYGIEKALINAGGNILVLGEKGENTPWKIGIQDPRDEKQIIATLNLKDQAAVTSGDYQRYFLIGGQRYHHLLDPKTGRPARHLISVTVIAPNSTVADILSTSFFVMGLEKSLAYLEKHPELGAVFVTPEKEVILSPGLESVVELRN